MTSARTATPHYHLPRLPGELVTRRLYVTRRAGPRPSRRDMCARAFELYLEGPPCMKEPYCCGRAGHEGGCILVVNDEVQK
jgi:hypothetical protein